jgi:glutathione synthase/RimK-type ligase-like ATP-grasp enzyme
VLRLAFLTPAEDYPDRHDWAFDVQAEALRSRGATVDAVRWTDCGDLAGYDLVLPLVAWGYHLRYAEWLAFLDRVEREPVRIVNPTKLLRWNSHKRYLAELGDKGVPTVPTLSVEQCSEADLATARERFGNGRLVIKPPVSAGAFGTFLLDAGAPLPDEARGRPTIIQPMLETVASEGEYSLLLFDGVLSHAIVKRPRPGDFRVQPHFGGLTERCEPPEGSLDIARSALAAAPAPATYARVDMIRGNDGALQIMELELIEPALFLDVAPGSQIRFADAVLLAAERARH